MILVTGATGTVGREIIRELKNHNISFRVLVHKQRDSEVLKAQGIETVQGDLAQPKSVRRAVQGIDHVYLLSPGVPQLPNFEQAFAEEAKAAGVQHIVKHSVLGAGEDEHCLFMKWHELGEKAIKSSGIPYTFLRLNGFMQNIIPFYARSIAEQGVFYAPMGDALVSHVDVRDIAAVARHTLTDPGYQGKVYNITGPEAITNTQIAEKLSSLLGRPIKYISVSDDMARQSLISSGAPEWNAEAVISLYQFYRQEKGAIVSDAIEKITGQKPRTIDNYLAENLQAFS